MSKANRARKAAKQGGSEPVAVEAEQPSEQPIDPGSITDEAVNSGSEEEES